jgi:hypothetical protein
MRLYTVYDTDGNFFGVYAEEKPENATENVYTGNFIKPLYDLKTDTFFEGANNEEKTIYINSLELQYRAKIHELIWLHLEKHKMRELTGESYIIPQEIIDEYNQLRQEFNSIKLDILDSIE